MNLKILLPSRMFLNATDVTRLVIETSQGCWGILPHRRDCVATLIPGVLTFESPSRGLAYVAVDIGMLVKTHAIVQVSVRRAVTGTALEGLRKKVEQEFAVLDQTEREVRHLSEKLENGFMRKMVALHRE